MIEAFINMNGQAREAGAYYARAFGGAVTFLETYARLADEGGGNLPDNKQERVMHSTVSTFAGILTVSDKPPGQEAAPTDALSLAVSHPDAGKLKAAFDALALDGRVVHPAQSTFFSPLYGMLVDKYGYSWIFLAREAAEKTGWRAILRRRAANHLHGRPKKR